jgi:hypothetical protein
MIIMAFYPIHQTYGQLSGVIFFATGRTALYRNIGVFAAMLGIPLAYVLVAPARLHGLELGASGLAAKMVVYQILVVNIQLYFNARMLDLKFGRYLVHQIGSLMAFIVVALAARWLAALVTPGGAIEGLVVSAIVYAALVAGVAVAVPDLLGVRRSELVHTLETITTKLRRHDG